ncbi:Protein CBR-USE-1 [Caenorhabditis briggsae]|uniref:Vesicle transport protein USE1 n=1 Tax=Caenorhabditis briggsae TaxID=6238 RepID=A8XBV1_CAEBR|nr:Protein CBR-USE-1 [Caenorhabditis briggsae]CAP30117.2 Protein CBR-USE-1 [Caenorhabditis briggsae]
MLFPQVSAATKLLNGMIYTLQDDNKLIDILHEYRQEVLQLKLLAEAESKSSTEESLKVIEKIPCVFADVPVDVTDVDSSNLDEFEKESAAGLRAVQRSIYRTDLRRQLLSTTKQKMADTSEDDKFIKNERLEEDLANDLLSMTKSLKTVMSAAGEVIKDDNQKLTKMQKQVESNTAALELQSKKSKKKSRPAPGLPGPARKVESARAAHHAYKCGLDCMRVFLFMFLLMSFVSMVMVMKIFPKRATY